MTLIKDSIKSKKKTKDMKLKNAIPDLTKVYREFDEVYNQEIISRLDHHIMCDNPNCGHVIDVLLGEVKSYINYHCPLCGENMLTEEAYKEGEKELAVQEEIMKRVVEEMKTQQIMPFQEILN